MTDTATPTLGFDLPPYSVETFIGGWCCVNNKLGFNCLSFTAAPGVKFTYFRQATEICDRWNSKKEDTR